jgi:hypothetical protein
MMNVLLFRMRINEKNGILLTKEKKQIESKKKEN